MAEFKQLAARHMNSAASKAVLPMRRINAHELKASRDYSFIFSDNAENPTLLAATSVNKNLKPCQLKSPKCKVNLDEQQIPLSMLHSIRKQKGKTSPEPWKAEVKPTTKPIVEEKIEYVEPKKIKIETKSEHLTSSKAEASELQKADLLKPQLEQKKDDQLKTVKVVMPNKVKQLRRGLIESKVSKKQVGWGKQLRRLKEVLFAPQPQRKSLPKHQIKKSPAQKPLYDDEVDQSYIISSFCQSLFRRNHNKHARDYDSDYDNDCTVASFDEIQKEEKRRKEDRIEQLRIEQEDREERLKRKAKKQKLQ